jgi:hypothetical protein
MLSVRTRVTVKEDGTVEAKLLGGELPPGEHDAVIVLDAERPAKRFSMKDFPVDNGPWDDSVSLRREDMYGDDGR